MDKKTIFLYRLKNKIVKFISSNRNLLIFKLLSQFSENYQKAYKNASYDSSSNGENLVFKKLSKYNFDIVIDCGANTGTNTKIFKYYNPKSTIYAIEAIDETLEECKEFTKNYSNIFYFNIGLGSKRENVVFKYFPTHNCLSTKYENVSDSRMKYIEKKVEIYTGDEFCQMNNIEKVNFLKIDVEGMDFEVIKGFENKIKSNLIDAILFEYSLNFINSNSLLKDVYDFVIPNNYIIGKIYPNGVEFIDYNLKMEDYIDANFLIIRKDLIDVIDSLKE